MNKECGMVRDLLPLVIDEVASESSREYVETHLSGCAECTAVFEEMKGKIPPKTEQEKGSEQAAFSKAAEKLKRKKRMRTLRNILLGVVIGCVVLAGALMVYSRVQQAREPVYYGFYNVYLSELNNGHVVFTMDYNGSYDDLGAVVKEEKETDEKTGKERHILYVYAEKYLIPRKNENPMQNHGFLKMTAEDLQEYDEIRQGVPSEYRTIWTPGTKTGKASKQMEEYYFWDAIDSLIWEQIQATPDGKAYLASYEMRVRWNLVTEQGFAVAATVPEWQPWYAPADSLADPQTIQWILTGLEECGIAIPEPTPYENPPENE